MKKLLPAILLFFFSLSFTNAQTPVTEVIDFTATDVEGHE